MNRIDLKQVEHTVKIGDSCPHKTPNVTEDSLLYEDGVIVGFYIKDISKYSEKLTKLLAIANAEFRSERVPKSTMKRSSGLHSDEHEVLQYSTILGSVPPKPHMRRVYPTISSVHTHKSAATFIKAMYMAAIESGEIIKQIAPDIYNRQIELIQEYVPKKWQFTELFTSSISNYNISADCHRDNGNIKGCINVILAKKQNATGGNLHVPDYDATFDSCDNSMLVYPAWRNMHSVTPIVAKTEGGYRNSLIFYPLKAFRTL